MSGTAEERWRTRGQQNSRNPPNQQQRRGGSRERPSAGGYQNQGRQGSGNQGPSTIQGNAWVGDRPTRGQNSGAMPEEQHVPVGGFNARETREALRKGFQDAINSADSKPAVYKASGGERTAGPWGSKSNTMANGQDFFVQLRKGMAALQQGPNNNTNA